MCPDRLGGKERVVSVRYKLRVGLLLRRAKVPARPRLGWSGVKASMT